jgi:Rrf2 family protein
LYLARRAEEAPDVDWVAIGAIARAEGISEPYAGRLLRILAKANIVEIVRGRGGGLRLARPPSEISIGEVLGVLGGLLYEPGTCDRYTGSNHDVCVHTTDCSIRSLWSGLQRLVDTILSRATLQDLVHGERSVSEWITQHIALLDASLGDGQRRGLREPSSRVIAGSEIERLDFAAPRASAESECEQPRV